MSDHRCVAGRDCRRAETVDGRRGGALTEKPDTLCDPCRERIASAVHQLPRDFAELRDALGERAPAAGQRIRSTPKPAIPISTRKEALMSDIADMLARAAAIVSDALHTGDPAAYKGRGYPEHAEKLIRGCTAITEPNIDLLAAAPRAPAVIWAKPRRCDIHERAISHAECMVTVANRFEIETARLVLRGAYTEAGACDDCNGWGRHGQQRELVDISGLQIALELVKLHNLTRAELGKTRMRQRYRMPCPQCGGRLGRDDGTIVITCDDCQATWTERERQFFENLITSERLDMEITKYLLAEAYSRLDQLAALINKLGDDPIIDVLGLRNILGDHQPPGARKIATNRKAAEERQAVDDTRVWQNTRPYRRPPPKPHPTPRHIENPVHPASLVAELTDIDTITNGDARCTECNCIHAGQCL